MSGTQLAPPDGRGWLLLIHQLPPKPDYVRVKVRRRLHRLGAVPLKNSVYVLPESETTVEDFQWLAIEIVADGGDATICSATILSGVSDDDLEALFRAERDADYDELLDRLRGVDASALGTADELRRLRSRFDAIAAIDFFGSARKEEAVRAIEAQQAKLEFTAAPGEEPARAVTQPPRGAVWVTRNGVFIDRISSAWLIRRFIDPEARFRFVQAKEYRKTDGELRFDMYQAEFTHVGDRCTFETLLVEFSIDDPALEAIAQIVHDIDCKDDKFGREETAGVGAVIQGIARATPDDSERIARASMVFDGLYDQLRGGR